MSFNKKYITKEGILSNISSLDKYLESDALVKDMWSSKFCDDLNPNERSLRDELNENARFSSAPINQHPNYKRINSLSETLVYLMTDPQWVDILVTFEILNIPLSDDERGKFEILKERAIEYIIKYYEL